MFGTIGITELIVIFVVALLVIGPQRLPELAKSIGRALREFKQATSDLQSSLSLDEEFEVDPLEPEPPEKKEEEKPPAEPQAEAPDPSAPAGQEPPSSGAPPTGGGSPEASEPTAPPGASGGPPPEPEEERTPAP